MTETITTSISQVFPDRIIVKGYDLAQMPGRYQFGDVVYLLMTGDLPAGHEGDMIEAMLVAAAEHSANAPSVHTARTVAGCGVPLQSAVAAGISAIGDYHGGAGEACARILQEAVSQNPDLTPKALAAKLVADFRQQKKRLPGFGHRFHTPVDPRSQRLLLLADEWRISGPHIVLARALEAELALRAGRPLPMNVDGAMAAILSDMGIDWRYGKAIFIIARTAGLAAHVHEEITTGKPLQFAGKREIDYVGPPQRPLPHGDHDD